MKKIDVLWLIEHTVREMDVACAVKSLLETRYGVDTTIRNIYLHANDVMKEYSPSVVVFPFLYGVSDPAIEDYITNWPTATYFNFAWEQVHYKAHLKMKAPRDGFTRKKVLHQAWGDFYKDYLIENEVPPEHIFVNGNSVYQLYKEPYRKYFRQRDQLAQQNGLDPSKKWIFIPENYKWAFFTDEKLQRSASKGGNLDEHLNMRAFCQESLAHLLQWCNEAAKNDELEIIFRPRPATNSQQMEKFFGENVGAPSKHLHSTKAETVREWILASDVVISSYSTSLIEAAIAGKPIYIVEPLPIPESLNSDWYRFVPSLRSNSEFTGACLTPDETAGHELQAWAQAAMLPNGDPIEGLAGFIHSLIEEKNILKDSRSNGLTVSGLGPSFARGKLRVKRLSANSVKAIQSLGSSVKSVFLSIFVTLKGEKRSGKDELDKALYHLKHAVYILSQGIKSEDYFNPVNHENDVFTDAEVNVRVSKWHEILASH